MQLFFGMAGDGRTFPDHLGGGAGAVDCAVVGPAGLVDALEVQLGLLGPPVPKAVRIAAYLAKLRAAGDSRFWSASFSKDPWSTAVQLLGWRDTLAAGGWTGAALGSVRLDDLAAAESAGAPMPAGLADRLAALVTAVGVGPGLRLKKLRLLEPQARFAPAWRRLLNALQGVGVLLEDGVAEPAAGPSTDLGRVQATLRGEAPEALVGDGSFTLVEADTALMAAEAVADWLAAGGQASLAGTVVLAPDGDTALLDHALAARGLPALGLSKPSPWRGALQVLPLAFAVAWRPFDPKALLNLLMLPRPPIGRFAAGRLARVLVAEPGLDGPAWVQAWEDIAATLLESEDEPDPAVAACKVARQVEQWRAWTQGGQFGRGDRCGARRCPVFGRRRRGGCLCPRHRCPRARGFAGVADRTGLDRSPGRGRCQPRSCSGGWGTARDLYAKRPMGAGPAACLVEFRRTRREGGEHHLEPRGTGSTGGRRR